MYSLQRNEMTRTNKENSDTSVPEPPAGKTFVVDSNREETVPAASKDNKDDVCGLKPAGGLHADNAILKTAKNCLKIGTWNVRTLYQLGKLDNLTKEAKDMDMEIMGIAEHRWTEEGNIRGEEYHFIYSGGKEHQHGVGFLIKNSLTKYIMGTWPVSERNILLKIRAKPFNIAIIQTYAPTTDYSEQDIEIYYEELQKVIKEVKSTEILIIMGDFNAKVGNGKQEDIVGGFGLGKQNERGERLFQFCHENNLIVTNTFFQQHPRRLYTWTSPNDITRNQIDYILISKRFRNSIKKCKTYPGADINSDHNPVIAKMKIRLKNIQQNKQRKSYVDIGKLKSTPELQEQYNIAVKNKFQVLQEESVMQYRYETKNEKIDVKWECIRDSIRHGNESLPKQEKKAKQPWMTEEILELMTQRKTKKNTNLYTKLNAEIQKRCKEAKEEWIQNKCNNIEKAQKKNDTKRMHEDIRELTGKKKANSTSNCIKSKNGEILFEQTEVLNRWSQYIGELFEDERSETPTPTNKHGPPILTAEVENAIKKTKDGKAQGEDGITTEMLKALGEFSITTLTDLFNDIYESGHIPDELTRSVFITLPKKPKANECADFRTISLMPHVTKILLRVILERIKQKINREVGEEQFGFRAENGTREGIFCLNNITQRCIEKQQDIYACFIDYAKAFDRVHHTHMIKCMEKIGIDGKDIRIITSLYWHQKAAIRIQNKLSPYTPIKRGVRQGCVLSPYLFNIYTEFIFRESTEMNGVNIGGRNINNLRYADDTVLITNNQEDLQSLVNTVKENSEINGLEMNVKKTKVMVMSKKTDKKATIKINGKELEQVVHFKYLGQQITVDGKSENEIKIRIGTARTCFTSMSSLLTSRHISFQLRLRLVQCYVYSVLLYGSETWTLTKSLEKKIEAFEMWIFRRLGKISWTEKKTNQEVCTMLNVKPTLLRTIKSRKLQYFGHIKRHDSICKNIMEGNVEGKRARGRQRRTWMDDIKDWTNLSLQERNRQAENRERWRVISSRPHSR